MLKTRPIAEIPHVMIPIYEGRIYFPHSLEEFRQLQKHFKADKEDKKLKVLGLSQSIKTKTEGYVYLLGVFDNHRNTFAHECGHTAMHICENAGFKANAGSGEPFCYLLGWLTDQCASNFKHLLTRK